MKLFILISFLGFLLINCKQKKESMTISLDRATSEEESYGLGGKERARDGVEGEKEEENDKDESSSSSDDDGSVGEGGVEEDTAEQEAVEEGEEAEDITYYADRDGDGYGDPSDSLEASSQPSSYVTDNTDCNDSDADINPGEKEVCGDAIDNNCNGVEDPNVLYYDGDGDGYGDPDNSIVVESSDCTFEDYAELNTDCNDSDASINPGEDEVCDDDDTDEDCSGEADDDDTNLEDSSKTAYYEDDDGDDSGDSEGAASYFCNEPDSGYSDNNDDWFPDDSSKTTCTEPEDDEYVTDTCVYNSSDTVVAVCATESTSDDGGSYEIETDCDSGSSTEVGSDTEFASTCVDADDVDDNDCDGVLSDDFDYDASLGACNLKVDPSCLDNDVDTDDDNVCDTGGEYITIDAAVDAAGDGDFICVTAGTYYEVVTFAPPSGALDIKLYCLDQDPDSDGDYACVIDGDTNEDGTNDDRLLLFDGSSGAVTNDTVVSGFTLQNGYRASDRGAGLYVSKAYPTLKNLVIKGCESPKGGNTWIGAGLYIIDSGDSSHFVQLSNMTISGNTASKNGYGKGGKGGGVAIYASYVNAQDLVISSNTSTQDGGGLYVKDSYVTMSSSKITDNISEAPSSTIQSNDGGGVYIDGSDFVLSSSEITGNESAEAGGGLYIKGSSIMTLNAVEISDNTSAEEGGGLYLATSYITAINLLIAGNEATGDGGGAYLNTGTSYLDVDFLNMTVVANESTGGSGGGLYIKNGNYLAIQNSIIRGNTADTSANDIYNKEGVLPSLSYSNIDCTSTEVSESSDNFCDSSDDVTGTGNITADCFNDFDNGDYTLLSTATDCIDKGNYQYTDSGLTTYDLCDLDGDNVADLDLAGNPRCSSDGSIDMGAYEYTE